jgi:hypothetical protein
MSAEAVKTPWGPYIINCQAPDEGNMHTLLHFGTDAQKEKWLRPLCEGTLRSCFSMTEPEVAGSDPTQIQTSAVEDGDEWVINGHKWFTSGAHGADFAIVIARSDPDADIAQARNSAFIVPLASPGFEIVRDVQTMGGGGGHPEVRYTNVRIPKANMLGERGGGHKLGQVRLGPARLAHCMRWLGQIEQALELYASKLMVRHAAYKVENGMDFRAEVSMADRRNGDALVQRNGVCQSCGRRSAGLVGRAGGAKHQQLAQREVHTEACDRSRRNTENGICAHERQQTHEHGIGGVVDGASDEIRQQKPDPLRSDRARAAGVRRKRDAAIAVPRERRRDEIRHGAAPVKSETQRECGVEHCRVDDEGGGADRCEAHELGLPQPLDEPEDRLEGHQPPVPGGVRVR